MAHSKSFFRFASYHGQPFRGAGRRYPSWWGGYCNHGNVLFPVWHRAYLLAFENALRSIDGCEDVTLPHWDEVSVATAEQGLPDVFLMRTFPLAGQDIDNPLFSYRFGAAMQDSLQRPTHDYSKHKGYRTVRYPFSGLVGKHHKSRTDYHNQEMEARGYASTDMALKNNIRDWLGQSITLWNGNVVYTGARGKYEKCLAAPNYTVFSNTTSAAKWNEDHFQMHDSDGPIETSDAEDVVFSVETPHNSIHLAVGKFEIPEQQKNFNSIQWANGDMSENDTAAFDPLFFFHHCFVDMVFWQWQERYGRTARDQLDR